MEANLPDVLKSALQNERQVEVVYAVGSQPGTRRLIIPTAIADAEIRAICVASGIVKTFKLEELSLSTVDSSADKYDPNAASSNDAVDLMSVAEVSEPLKSEMESRGWHIVTDHDSIAVCSCFKNGKPKKTPDVCLSYSEFVFDLEIDEEGNTQEVKRLASRPYRLASKSFASARTFSKLSSAWQGFLNEMRARAPR